MLLDTAATAGLARRWLSPLAPVTQRLRAVPAPLTLAATLALATAVWAGLQRAEPFPGHDESIYAGQARAWATGITATYWESYRPVGLPALGSLALRISDSTTALRLLALALGLATLVVVYAVTASLTSPHRAAAASLVVLSGVTFLRRLPEFLDDIPAAGLLLATAFLVLRSRRPRGAWALPAAAVTGAATVLVRYGAAAGLIAIPAAALVVWGPRVWLRAWRQVLAALAVLAVCLTPFAAYSLHVSGSVLGVLTRSQTVGGRDYLGQGLVYDVQAFPLKLAGPLGAVVMVAALGWVAVRCLPGRRTTASTGLDRRDRELVFLALAGVFELVLLGVVAHGESRFVLFTVLTLSVVGVEVIGRAGATALLATAATAVASIAAGYLPVHSQVAGAAAPVISVDRVAGQIPRDGAAAAAHRCVVVSRLPAEAAWASGCVGSLAGDLHALPSDLAVYVIEFPGAPGWSGQQPQVRALDPRRTWSVRVVPGTGQLGDAVLAVSPPLD